MPGPVMDYEIYYVFNLITILIFIAILLFYYVSLHGHRSKTQKIDEVLSNTGYSYDHAQDIFYSRKDAWQKGFGYSQIYDEAAAPMGMIIDCEPVRFYYGGKKWLIELWKGQYGMTTGCEIGVYTAPVYDVKSHSISDSTFYECADEKDQLYMSFILWKNNRILFSRQGLHWWLTGFVLGEFSEPYELIMDTRITFKDKEMCDAFVNALYEIGYSPHLVKVNHTTVRLSFIKPLSPQPLTRTPVTDSLMQKKNRILCNRYSELTMGRGNSLEKLEVLWMKAPKLFESVLNMGKPLKLFRKGRPGRLSI